MMIGITDYDIFTAPFDYETHKKNFINYLEAVILKDGKIEYAVPSHAQRLEVIYCKAHNISMNELYNIIPITDSPVTWIIYKEGIIAVWYDFIMRPEVITKEQQDALDKLRDTGCINKDYESKVVFKNKYNNINTKDWSEINGGY